MRGQVYVKVEADEASPMLMDVGGSSGAVVGSYEILWELDGGVTGSQGWPNNFDPNGKTEFEITEAIKTRWMQLSRQERNNLYNKWNTINCAFLL